MSVVTSEQHRDAFGAHARERFLRRLVAATIAASLFAACFSMFLISARSLWAVALGFLLMLPLSYALEGRSPGRPGWRIAVRYGLLGAVLGCAIVGVLIQALPSNWLLISASVGAVSGGLGTWVATVAPTRWVVASGVTACLLAVGTWIF